jgi:hypothetical protein
VWIDHNDFAGMGLEEAIIRQLSHMRYFDSIHPRRRRSITPAEFVDLIAHLITFILRSSRESSAHAYRRLVSRLFPIGEPRKRREENRIVTFNYDALVDEHLLARFSPERVYFDRIKRKRDQGARRTVLTEEPLLVKLHGSVNWRCETDEFKRIINGERLDGESYWISSVWFDNKRCPSPEDSESPCIIPPTPDKPLTKLSLFQFLWSRAAEYLSQAREIVICGYSLPDTDPLALSLFGNVQNSRLQRITVVDPNPAILARWRSLLARPGMAPSQWIYHSDFCEYVDTL